MIWISWFQFCIKESVKYTPIKTWINAIHVLCNVLHKEVLWVNIEKLVIPTSIIIISCKTNFWVLLYAIKFVCFGIENGRKFSFLRIQFENQFRYLYRLQLYISLKNWYLWYWIYHINLWTYQIPFRNSFMYSHFYKSIFHILMIHSNINLSYYIFT